VQLAGWNATLSCVADGPGGQPAGTTSDCVNATSLWTSGPVTDPATGPGLVAEGCSGCVVGEYNSTWHSLCVQSSGTLAFTIDPDNDATDYNFAIYGPDVSCGALGTPIRCSGATASGNGNTGLGNGAVDNSENIAGDQWVAPLNVTAGETYYVLVNRYTNANAGYSFNFTGTASFENCDAPFVYNLSKTIAGTSETGTSDTQDGSAGNERPVAIGEVVTYSLSFAVPEGTTNNLSIVDNLPPGLQYVSGSAVFNQTSNNGITYSTTVTGGATAGQDVTFTLGNVTNSDNDVNDETIEITFDAVVVNEVGNQSGTLLSNYAELKIGGSTIATSENRTVVVVEPNLTVTVRQQDDYNGSDITEGDAGDEYVYRVSISNTGNAPAYDVSLTGMMPEDFASQYGTVISTGGSGPFGFTYNATTGLWGFNWTQIGAGGNVSVTIRFRVKDTVRPSESWTSTVDIAYSSLPGVDANERNGDDGAGGALDNYFVTATSPAFTVPEPSVAKQVEHPSQTPVAALFGAAYTDTSSDPNTNADQYSTANVDVAIGETFSYLITVTFPEGTTSDFTMIDLVSPNGHSGGLQNRVVEMLSAEVIHTGANLSGGGVRPVGTLFNVEDSSPADTDGTRSQLFTGGNRDVLNTPDNVTNDDDRYVIRITARMDDEDETGGPADDVPGVSNNAGNVTGNRLQYQWRDSDNAQYTRNLVARADIVEPSVSISATTNVGTDVDAGDQVKFTINLNNTGSATAYNLQVTDVLPFAGITNYVSFEAVDLATSTCDNLGGFTVNAGTPPNVVFNFDALAANTSCSITFTGIVSASVTPNETYTNQVSLTSYTSQPNATAPDVRTYTGGSASSVITTKEPLIVKSYVSTSEAHTDPGDTRNGASNASEVPLAIGELIRYNIALTLIEGLHVNLVIEDLLPAGIEALYNSNFQVSIPAGVSTTNSGLASGAATPIYNDAGMLLVNSFNLSPNPSNLSFFLGAVTTNTNTDNGVSEVIVIAFDAIVLNTAAGSNDIGDQRDNLAAFSEGAGASSGISNTVHARIQEPVVTIAKTLNTTLSNPAGVSTFKTGDEVVYDIVLTAGNASNQTNAFDLSVLDNLNADLDLVSVAFVGTPAYATTADNSDYTAPGQSVNVSISELRPGDAITIRVTATIVSNTCTGTINNTASMTYTSLPGLKGTNDATPGNSGTDKGERNGSGGINDYSGSDDAMISIDQRPDFTLNVVQPTCEMAGSISFAALSGGTYTYAFSTNGVDYTPLTPNMGQVSIALPADEQPATIYSIRVIRTDLATACETIKTANIQEVSDCCPDISAVLSGTTIICPGSDANISVAITGGLGSYTVVYSPDGGNTTATVNNYTSGAAIAVTPVQTTIYTLVSVADAENCPAMVSGNAVVTVEDVTDPVFDCNTLMTITANTASGACNANVSITAPMATDNCDGPVAATGVRSDQAVLSAPYPTGTTTITWTFEDAAGNSIQCMQNVMVTDNTPPTITCPATQTLVLGANCTAALPDYTSLATTGDNCGVLGVTQSPAIGATVSGAGNMTVTLTVTDINGNNTECNFTVTKVDNTPPTITCPSTQTLVLGANCTASLPDYTSLATTGDNCGVLGVTQSPTIGATVSGAGNMTVTLTVTDTNGNSTECNFTVTKVDNTPPTLVCKANTVLLGATGSYTLLTADVFDAVASSDNCSGELVVTHISPATVNCSQLGQTIPVTVTVQDAAGNSAACIAQITVQEGSTTPLGWSSNNVGNANGSSGYKPCTSDGQFTVAATGFSTSSSDVLHLTARQLCGNGEIIARVASVNSGGWAGITLRESLAQGSKKVALKTQFSTNIRREIRTTTNGAASILNFFRPQHTWLRLVRNGSNFVGYTSHNGTTWDFAFSATVSMAGCIHAGLFAESINNSVTTTAVFDNVTVTGAIAPLAGPDNPATIAIEMPDFEVYPNPTTGEVTVNLSAYANRMVRLELYGVQGKALKVLEVDAADATTQRLDLSAYQNGIYLIRVQSEGLPDATKRVVVQR